MAHTFLYLDALEEQNTGFAEMKKLYLYPGMEFRSEIKWWPDKGKRVTPHEGLDICYYIDATGKECVVSPAFRVPVMETGKIVSIRKDYLGETVFLDHEYEQSSRFLSIYAHITPLPDLKIGDCVRAGDTIGTIADTTGKKNRIPAHLHISLMVVARVVPAEQFDWHMISYPDNAQLIDPLKMFDTEKISFQSKNHWKERYGF